MLFQCVDTVGGRRGGMNWETGVDIHMLLDMKQITSKDLLYSTGNSTWCSVATWMGGKSKREGIRVYIWLVPFAVHQELAQHCKATIHQ